jgi:hypothetical protein
MVKIKLFFLKDTHSFGSIYKGKCFLVRTFAREISRTRGKASIQRATVVSALFLWN